MSLFLAALAAFALAILGMSLGVLLRGRCLRGTCGGLSRMKDQQGRPLCDACSTAAETGESRADDRPVPEREQHHADSSSTVRGPASRKAAARQCVEDR